MKCGRIYKNFLPYPGTVQNGHTRAGPGSGTRYLVLYTVPGTRVPLRYRVLYSCTLHVCCYDTVRYTSDYVTLNIAYFY